MCLVHCLSKQRDNMPETCFVHCLSKQRNKPEQDISLWCSQKVPSSLLHLIRINNSRDSSSKRKSLHGLDLIHKVFKHSAMGVNTYLCSKEIY